MVDDSGISDSLYHAGLRVAEENNVTTRQLVESLKDASERERILGVFAALKESDLDLPNVAMMYSLLANELYYRHRGSFGAAAPETVVTPNREEAQGALDAANEIFDILVDAARDIRRENPGVPDLEVAAEIALLIMEKLSDPRQQLAILSAAVVQMALEESKHV